MDSGNSGSMQSSSGGGGGEEEYDSRGETFTSFLNPSGGQFGSISDRRHQPPPPLPPLFSHQYQTTLFNPHSESQNHDVSFAHSSSANTQYGDDLVWTRGLRSQPNHHPNFENLIALSSSSSSPSLSSSNQSLLGAPQMLNQSQIATSSQPAEGNNPLRAGSSQQSDQPTVARNPKKRTRASRRAPTTVLTTDTTNFRQMVQEFTGIPTAPFSSSSYSRRIDLFSGGSGLRSGNLDALSPLYPLRPSAQKLPISPFLAQSSSSSSLLSSTMIEALVSSSTNTMNQGTTNNASSTTPDLVGLPKQPQNLLSMQNQILSFQQSALPTSLKTSSPILGTRSEAASTSVAVTLRNLGPRDTTLQQGVAVSTFDDFGLSHENVNANLGNIQQLGSTISGNYKFNCSASTSGFHSDKGLENVSSGGEGTVGPWICPSDH